jgi:photosystem II stability/assembly factor-like uncharacterized protein
VGGLPATTVNGFAVSPANAQLMYVAMRDGIFQSEDAGKSWKRSGALQNAVAIAINPKKPAELYAVTADGTVFRSGDGGGRWDAAR